MVPILISSNTCNVVSVRGEGPPLPLLRTIRHTFWESLMSGGRVWMWDYISNRSLDTSWMKKALEQKRAILAMDRSYSRTRGPNVCGARWVLACCKSRKILCGFFYKFSSSTNAYRGELLGLVLLHTFSSRSANTITLERQKGKSFAIASQP